MSSSSARDRWFHEVALPAWDQFYTRWKTAIRAYEEELTMHVDKFYKDETSGKRIHAILFEGEDCHDLENVGDGRAKTPNRWVPSQYAELLMAFRENRIEFIAFTRLSAKVCARGNYGLGRHLFIREAAIAHLKAMGDNQNPKVDTPSFETYPRSPRRGPYRPRQAHHHVRPRRIGTG